MRITPPNNGAAPNRRLRPGLVPSSLALFRSQIPAVGELGRSLRRGHAGWVEQEATEATEEKGADSLFSQFPPVDLAA